MAWWHRILGAEPPLDRVDYEAEGDALLREGKFHEALTSFRLALKEAPGDTVILQKIAVTYSRIGMTEEAARTYRDVLQRDPLASGAHYGLAFIHLRAGNGPEAERHLEAFLQRPSGGADLERHIQHARTTLDRLRGGGTPSDHV
jgi:tetratricopeptide (TPR) repeat protein